MNLALGALAAQFLSSGATFILNLYLLNELELVEFGKFGIAFAASLFIFGFWQAIFITQYIVLAQDKESGVNAENVYGAMSVALAIYFLGAATIAAALSTIGAFASAFSVSLTAAALCVKEFHVRHSFSIGRPWIGVVINAVFVVSMILILFIVWSSGLHLTHSCAMIIYAVALGFAGLVGHKASAIPIRIQPQMTALATAKLLSGGKWSLISHISFAVRDNSHIAIATAMIGASAVAHINAARLFVTPPIMLLPAFGNLMLPFLTRSIIGSGTTKMVRDALWAGSVLSCIVIIYSAVLLASWEWLEPRALSAEYSGIFGLVILWCFYTLCLAIRTVMDIAAQSKRQFRRLAIVGISGAALSIITAYLTTQAMNEEGAVMARALAEVFIIAMLALSWPSRLNSTDK